MVDWNDLVREHRAAIYGVAWRSLGHVQDAEDVVQEVFAEAHRQPDGAPVICWAALLRRIAACRALDALRRRRAVLPLNGTQLAPAKEDPAAIAAGRELESRLRTALAELAPREAEVFCLRYFELGDKDRIVCWYKLKAAKDQGTYRVVYGDLSVKDVAAKDLPLPVQP